MVSIRDTIRSKNYPVINNALIFINVIVLIIEMGNPDQFVLMMLPAASCEESPTIEVNLYFLCARCSVQP